jgi:hypothetical protein
LLRPPGYKIGIEDTNLLVQCLHLIGTLFVTLTVHTHKN